MSETGQNGGHMNVAYNLDCMEAMREMPDKAFELAIEKGVAQISLNHSAHRTISEKYLALVLKGT